MALAPAGVSRVSLFKAFTSGFNGGSRNRIAGDCYLIPPRANASLFSQVAILNLAAARKFVSCSAVQQESSTPAAAETQEEKPKPKPKPAVKKLPEMMEEDVIPALQAILQPQEDITDLQLSFKDNRLEGSFVKIGIPYSFWAFFPDGVLTGPKGFAISSYGSEVSTIEPFLIDEKKITAKHVVFWVEKRLAAQGIIPVWNY